MSDQLEFLFGIGYGLLIAIFVVYAYRWWQDQ